MKRFLKVILIMAVVFGVLGLGLTAGGAAMGATMGDVGILDNGLKRILGIFQDHSVTDDNTWDNAWYRMILTVPVVLKHTKLLL